MGSTYEVNNAAITCGNLRTANTTVYIINTVLMPSHLTPAIFELSSHSPWRAGSAYRPVGWC